MLGSLKNVTETILTNKMVKNKTLNYCKNVIEMERTTIKIICIKV